jgi:rhodanese-related sulfurtransferase
VQETDIFAPVRGARILLFDDLSVRAEMSASWLAQMGWQVLLLEGVKGAQLTETGPWRPTLPSLPPASLISPARAAAESWVSLDLGPGPRFRRRHIAGAHFVIRARLARDLPPALAASGRLLLVSEDDGQARFAAADLAEAGIAASVLEGGMQGWGARPTESGEGNALSAFEDVYRRPYEGTDNPAEAMEAYLDWEFGLVEQLRRDATHGFWVLRP